MAKGGDNQVDETIVLTGTSASIALDRVERALRGLQLHEVVRQGPSTLQIARADKTLLGRKLAVCVVSAATEPQRVSVSLIGDVLPAVAACVRAALSGPADPSTPAATFAPVRPPAAVSAPFVPPDDWFLNPYDSPVTTHPPPPPAAPPPPVGARGSRQTPPPPPPVSTPARSPQPTQPPPPPVGSKAPTTPPPPPGATVARPTSGPVVQLSDGRVLAVRGEVLVGRAPRPLPGFEGASCLPVGDAELSKTHCAFGVELRNGELVAWVEDLHSTNGSFLATGGRPPAKVEPGSRVYASLPATIEAGATRLTVSVIAGAVT